MKSGCVNGGAVEATHYTDVIAGIGVGGTVTTPLFLEYLRSPPELCITIPRVNLSRDELYCSQRIAVIATIDCPIIKEIQRQNLLVALHHSWCVGGVMRWHFSCLKLSLMKLLFLFFFSWFLDVEQWGQVTRGSLGGLAVSRSTDKLIKSGVSCGSRA